MQTPGKQPHSGRHVSDTARHGWRQDAELHTAPEQKAKRAPGHVDALVGDCAALGGELGERHGPPDVDCERREEHDDKHAAEGVPEERRHRLRATAAHSVGDGC